MEQNPVVPTVETVAVIICGEERILLIFNEQWGAFTLPMTKLRHWQDPNIPPAHRDESPIDATARAVAECLGRTLIDGLVAIKTSAEALPAVQRVTAVPSPTRPGTKRTSGREAAFFTAGATFPRG
ncbi:MAG: hypothetical protein ACQESR_11030 [Planctomycetota bacterium]